MVQLYVVQLYNLQIRGANQAELTEHSFCTFPEGKARKSFLSRI